MAFFGLSQWIPNDLPHAAVYKFAMTHSRDAKLQNFTRLFIDWCPHYCIWLPLSMLNAKQSDATVGPLAEVLRNERS
jgi:hypothetical protein